MNEKEIIDEDLVYSNTRNPGKKLRKIPKFIFIFCSFIFWITFVIDYFFSPKIEKYINQWPPNSQPNFGEMEWLTYYNKYSEWGPYILIFSVILWIFSLTLTFFTKESKIKTYILIFGLTGFLSHLYLLWITIASIYK